MILPSHIEFRLALPFTCLFLALLVPASAAPRQWTLGGESDRARLSKVRRLAKTVQRVPSNRRRMELLDEMIELARGYDAAVLAVQEAVQDVWALGNRRAGKRSFEPLFKETVSSRRAIDELRKTALELIRDESRYPYPCAPPHAPEENRRRYELAQPLIEDATRAIRHRLASTPAVEMPERLVEALALIQWSRAAQLRAFNELSISIELGDTGLPTWFYGIPIAPELGVQTVSLASMAFSRKEAEVFADNARVESSNQDFRKRALGQAKNADAKKVVEDEFEVLRLTNEYRRLLGLRSLLWDPRLQTSCSQHAEYLYGVRDVAHEQPTEASKTPTLRAKHAGYPAHVFENCHLGSTTADDAFKAWTRSSGHHRALLMEEPREIGIARFGDAWVECFGFGKGYLDVLGR